MTKRSMSTSAHAETPAGMSGRPNVRNSESIERLTWRGDSEPSAAMPRSIGTSMISQPSATPARMPAAPMRPTHTNATESAVVSTTPPTCIFANVPARFAERNTCTSTLVRKFATK